VVAAAVAGFAGAGATVPDYSVGAVVAAVMAALVAGVVEELGWSRRPRGPTPATGCR
jgi:hypothetical protein